MNAPHPIGLGWPIHCKKWGVTVHLCHGVLGHFHVCWCNVTLQGVSVHNGVFHNTIKKCSKVFVLLVWKHDP